MSFYLEKEGFTYKVRHTNGTDMGELSTAEDGFYGWWPPENMQGYLPEYFCRFIGDALAALNFMHNEEIAEYFRKREQPSAS